MTRKTRSVILGTRRMLAYNGLAWLSSRFLWRTVVLLLLAIFLPIKAAALLPVWPVLAVKNRQRVELAFTENVAVDTEIKRGPMFDKLIIDVPWTSTVTADATAVRTRGAPIKTISFIGDANKTYYSAKLQDIIRMQEIFKAASLAQILTSPSGVTAAGGPYTGRVKLTIPFTSPHADMGELTSLASWRISKDPKLRIEWGSHAQVYRGGTGSTAVTSGLAHVMLVSVSGFAVPAGMNVNEYGDSLGVKVETYDEKTYTAANAALKQEVPTTADLRAIVITGEDNNGDPLSEAEMAKISFDLKENTYSTVQAGINLGTLRAQNVEDYGFSSALPPGTAVLDFADDKDILNLYLATTKASVDLVFNVAVPAAGTYTLRCHFIGIEPGRAVTVG